MGEFDRLIALLPSSVQFAPHPRGHRRADKPETAYSLPGVVEDVVAVLEALGVTRAHVLGSSSGGYVAQQLAPTHSQHVASLTLVGGPLRLHWNHRFAVDVDALSDSIGKEWVRGSLSSYRLLHTVPASYIEDGVRHGLAMPAAIWKASLRGFYEAIPPTDAGTISVSTLILCGAHDHLVRRYHHEALAERIPGSRLKFYAETSHLVL